MSKKKIKIIPGENKIRTKTEEVIRAKSDNSWFDSWDSTNQNLTDEERAARKINELAIVYEEYVNAKKIVSDSKLKLIALRKELDDIYKKANIG